MALNSAWKQMSWLYYQYLLVTALYMLEPWERTVFSSFDGVPIQALTLYVYKQGRNSHFSPHAIPPGFTNPWEQQQIGKLQQKS
ncbi:UNVERIFIED_CONTAM: hypothetical protein K2H54_041649 [Gekko kuhli]